MAAHFEIRQDSDREWVALVGGNGETIATSETYEVGHGNALRAVETIARAAVEAQTVSIRTPTGPRPWTRRG